MNRPWGRHSLCVACKRVRTKHRVCSKCATKETRYMEKKLTAEERAQRYREEAKRRYEEEGTLEIDEDAPISQCEKGAYVQAWVWVYNEDAGVTS